MIPTFACPSCGEAMVILKRWIDTSTGISPTTYHQYTCKLKSCQKIAAKERAAGKERAERKKRLEDERKSRKHSPL